MERPQSRPGVSGVVTDLVCFGTLSVFVLWSFHFMVSVGVVVYSGLLSRDMRFIYYPVPLLLSFALLGLYYPRVAVVSCVVFA